MNRERVVSILAVAGSPSPVGSVAPMPELRWILIVCGALLLVGIYAWGRRGSRQSGADDDTLLRVTEPPREAQGPYALRDEPSTGFDDVSEAEPSLADVSEPPIVANRRYRDNPPVPDIGSDDDTIEVDEPEPPLSTRDRDARRVRIEPTLGHEIEAESSAPAHIAVTLPAERPADRAPAVRTSTVVAVSPESTSAAAPTLSMSSTPPPRRTERRKIIALRIAAGTPRFTGAQLLESLQAEHLQHGKYGVFHRLASADASLFSIASMVEPGTFDPARMQSETYPGITMFAQFPGPADAVLTFNDMVSCARRLHERLGGTLQDERGVPLTVHRVERLRQELRDFEQGQAREDRHADATP